MSSCGGGDSEKSDSIGTPGKAIVGTVGAARSSLSHSNTAKISV